MKQLLGIILCMAMGTILVPATISPDAVPDKSHADYIQTCVDIGLMDAIGEDGFDSEADVTLAEAYAVTARLHNIIMGGSGEIPEFPKDGLDGLIYFEDDEGNYVANFSNITEYSSGLEQKGYEIQFDMVTMEQLKGQGDAPKDLILVDQSSGNCYIGEYFYEELTLIGIIYGQHYNDEIQVIPDPNLIVKDGNLYEKQPSEGYRFLPENNSLTYEMEQNLTYIFSLITIMKTDPTLFLEAGSYCGEYWYFNYETNRLDNYDESKSEVIQAFDIWFAQQYEEEILLSSSDICPRNSLAYMIYAVLPHEILTPAQDKVFAWGYDTQLMRELCCAEIFDNMDDLESLNSFEAITRGELAEVLVNISARLGIHAN